jgi:hypothetical protein
MPAPREIHIPLSVHIHQHNGDPGEDCEVSIGGRSPETVPAAGVGGHIRRLVMEAIRDFEV